MMSLTFGLFTQVSGSGPLGPLVMKFSPKCNTNSVIGKSVIKFGNFYLYLGNNRGR